MSFDEPDTQTLEPPHVGNGTVPDGICTRCRTGKINNAGRCLRCNPIARRGKRAPNKKHRGSDPRIQVELEATQHVVAAISGLKKDAASRIFAYVLSLIDEG